MWKVVMSGGCLLKIGDFGVYAMDQVDVVFTGGNGVRSCVADCWFLIAVVLVSWLSVLA